MNVSLRTPRRANFHMNGRPGKTEARLGLIQAVLSMVTEAAGTSGVVHLTEVAAELLARYPDSQMTITEIEAEIIYQARLARIAVLISP